MILGVLVMVLCYCTSSYGADAAGHEWYMGIGGSWASENFDADDVEDFLAPIDVDFDDAFGINANVGYHVNDNLSIAFVYSFLTGFDSDESSPFEDILATAGITEDDLRAFGFSEEELALLETVDVSVGAEIEVDVMTFMFEGKYAMSGNLSPYLVLGIGLMYADTDGDVVVDVAAFGESASFSIGDSDSDTQACGKVGLGIDWWATPDVTVGLEGSYVFAFGDHEFDIASDLGAGDAEFRLDYFIIGLGIAYHF